MRAWLENVLGPDLAAPAMWIVAAAILLVVLYVLVRLARVLTSGTFVVGGRNRKPRLSVMDAAAVDARRRLVLVRRDDVEHLILIGGPTDVVVESNIQLIARARSAPGEPETTRPPRTIEEQAAQTTRPPQLPPRTQPPQPMPVPQPMPAALPAARQPATPPAARPAATTPPRPPVAAPQSAPLPAGRTQPPAMPRATPITAAPPADGVASFRRPVEPATRPASSAASAAPAAPVARPDPKSEIDSALLQELEASLDDAAAASASKPKSESSIQDEMARLLGSLSREKRQ